MAVKSTSSSWSKLMFALGVRLGSYDQKGKGSQWEVWQHRKGDIATILFVEYDNLESSERSKFDTTLRSCGHFGAQILRAIQTRSDEM